MEQSASVLKVFVGSSNPKLLNKKKKEMRFMWRLNSTIISSTMHIDIHSHDLPSVYPCTLEIRSRNFLSVERTQKIALFDFNVIISLCWIEECERNVDNNFCIYVHSFPFLLLSSQFFLVFLSISSASCRNS